uniref:Uncharacterized protein n=1 Tax=Candidatus Kentrum sp. DK TaxID=2126562 RepID=A0A450TA37_9GAMM|nr:MAG: hypothetical protein BECKDK2373B_GA0170837_11278 [Candidatus Kentron sp. DK]
MVDERCLPVGVDVSDDNVRVITAYYPNLHKWESNLKTRRTVR